MNRNVLWTTATLVYSASAALAAEPLPPPAPVDPETPHTGAAARELNETGLDERIAAEVRELLVTDPDINVEDLRVKVQGGIVTLEGRTGTAPNKHLAADRAGAMRGVRGVVNMIKVVPGLQKGIENLRSLP